MLQIKHKRLRPNNVLTLKEAEAEGYGIANTIKKQILQGKVEAENVGGIVWLVHRRALEEMVVRRYNWLDKRK